MIATISDNILVHTSRKIQSFSLTEQGEYVPTSDLLEVELLEYNSESGGVKFIIVKLSNECALFFDRNLITYIDDLIKILSELDSEEERVNHKTLINFRSRTYVETIRLVEMLREFVGFIITGDSFELKVALSSDYTNKNYIIDDNTENKLKKFFKPKIIVRSIKDKLKLDSFLKLEEDNTFYNEKIPHYKDKQYGDIEPIGDFPVKVYREVYKDGNIEERLKLSFGGYSEYTYDNLFINMLVDSYNYNGNKAKLVYHAGSGSFVYISDLLPVINKVSSVLNKRDITLHDDYWLENSRQVKGGGA